MLKYLGAITQPSGEIGVLEEVECSFVLKTKSTAASLGRMRIEMIAFKVKGRGPKFTWEILGIYRPPNDDMRVMEILAARTDYTRNSTKRSIIGGRGGNLNLPYADWN
jgi:hypothetical protein